MCSFIFHDHSATNQIQNLGGQGHTCVIPTGPRYWAKAGVNMPRVGEHQERGKEKREDAAWSVLVGSCRSQSYILLFTADTTEMLLLLLLRHIQHYGSPSSSAPSSTLPTASTLSTSHFGTSKSTNPTNAAMRFLAAPDPGAFKGDLGKKLGPILGKLAALELVSPLIHQF